MIRSRSSSPLVIQPVAPWWAATSRSISPTLTPQRVTACTWWAPESRLSKKRTLVYGVLQRLSSAELRQARRLDVERLAGARVAAGASGALGGVEGAEAHQGHHLVLPQARLHRADEGVNCPLGGGLRNLRRLRDLLNQIGLVHGTAS